MAVVGYKWLLTPRGTTYMTVQDDLLADIVPANAGWYAGEDPWGSLYGTPMKLASDARRLDVSPAWHSWVGAVPALELIRSIRPAALRPTAPGWRAASASGPACRRRTRRSSRWRPTTPSPT